MAQEEQTKDMEPRRGQKPQSFWGTILRLVKYMSKRSWALIAMVITAILAAALAALGPSVLGRATTIIFDGVTEGMAMREAGQTVDVFPIDFAAIRNIVFILIALYLFEALFRYLQRYITAVVAQRTVYDLRKDLKEKLATLPIEYFDTHSVGDIMSRAVNDIEQIANTLQRSMTQFILSIVTFVSVLAVMLAVDVRMSLIVIASVGLSAVFIAFIAPKSQKQFAEQQKVVGQLNDRVEEVYGGHTVVKTYTREEDEIRRLTKHSDNLYDASWRAQFFSGIMMPAVNLARDLGIFAITLYGGFGVLRGTISLGNVQAFIQYVNRFSQPVRQIAQLANSIQITVASIERVFEVLDEDEMEKLVSNQPEKTDTPYIVEFENVQFKYADMDELLMTDFNLTVKPGEMIAIVGPTGAGKSTLINLLERFYDVSGGSIRYKGKDVRDIDRRELRDNYAMVLQDTWLFNGTIWDNIAYGNEEATAEEIHRAAKAAYVDEFVNRLRKGYDTVLNEESSNISQGQKQLITIARAFLADPEILILDEATSSVDTRTEALVQSAMENILAGRTSFVVAHRLSTIEDADKIIVMNHGDVMETGTHDELLAEDGFYAEIYNAQFEMPDDMSMA
jgi:ATP-binding cassette subfamily B protein